jgi:hypothetical protein
MKFLSAPRFFSMVLIGLSLIVFQIGAFDFLAFSEKRGQNVGEDQEFLTPDTSQTQFQTLIPIIISEHAVTQTPVLPYDVDDSSDVFNEEAPVVILDLEVEPGEVYFSSDPVDEPDPTDPSLDLFVQSIYNGETDLIVGVYVQGVLELPVLQQPQDNVAYVSDQDGSVTQFQSPARYGITGFLAHNYLSGQTFYEIGINDVIQVVYGSGEIQSYQVSIISDYQRLSRGDLRSDFRNILTGEILSTPELFDRYYRGEHHLTLQTCLEGEGYSNYGVRMIYANPLNPISLP